MPDPVRPEKVELRPHAKKSSGRGRGGLLIALFVVAVLGTVAYLVVPMIVTIFKQDDLAKTGEAAPARLLSVRETNTKVNHRWVYELELEVYPEGRAPYQARVAQPLSNLHLGNLRPGTGAIVKFDPDEPHSIVVVSTGAPLPQTALSVPDPSSGKVAGACQRAADCCRKIAGENANHCDGFLNPVMPPDSCAAAFDGFSRAAAAQQISCQSESSAAP